MVVADSMVVLVVLVVVLVALTIALPNFAIVGIRNEARVRYPDTVR